MGRYLERNLNTTCPLVDWSKWTFIPDETVIPTLVRISNITKARDGVWLVTQDFSLKSNFLFQMFDYDGLSGCRGILRQGKIINQTIDKNTFDIFLSS